MGAPPSLIEVPELHPHPVPERPLTRGGLRRSRKYLARGQELLTAAVAHHAPGIHQRIPCRLISLSGPPLGRSPAQGDLFQVVVPFQTRAVDGLRPNPDENLPGVLLRLAVVALDQKKRIGECPQPVFQALLFSGPLVVLPARIVEEVLRGSPVGRSIGRHLLEGPVEGLIGRGPEPPLVLHIGRQSRAPPVGSAAASPGQIGGVRPGAHVGQVVHPLTQDPKVPRNLPSNGTEIFEHSSPGQFELHGWLGGSPLVDVEVVRKAKAVAPNDVVAPIGEAGQIRRRALLPIALITRLHVLGLFQKLEGIGDAGCRMLFAKSSSREGECTDYRCTDHECTDQ